ncbi:hypothetical protein V2J09_016848 [Rumex salicifolius]
MAVPEVDKKLLMELQAMGFPLARATRALHYSGNSSLGDAVTYIIDHENDPNIDQMPLIPMEIDIEAPDSFDITEEVKMRAEELRNGGHIPTAITDEESREYRKEELGNLGQRSREEKEKELERESEKERRRSGKQLLEAKQAAEENTRKRMIALREADKAEESRARERIRQKLEADKAERRSRHGLVLDIPSGSEQSNDSNLPISALPRKSISATKQSAIRAELLSECLRTLRRSCKGDYAKARRALETLHIYVRNVINHPDQRKYRRIRLTNPVFQDRVGSIRGGTRFLELCGFEKTSGQFLYLSKDKAHMDVLNAAMRALQSAMTNPFFGLLSIELPETSLFV